MNRTDRLALTLTTLEMVEMDAFEASQLPLSYSEDDRYCDYFWEMNAQLDAREQFAADLIARRNHVSRWEEVAG